MISARIKSVRKNLEREGADAFLLVNHEYSGQPGTRYLSGFSGSESILLLARRANYLITDGRYFSQVAREARSYRLIPSQESVLHSLKTLLGKLKIGRVLLDSEAISVSLAEKLESALRGMRVIRAPGYLKEMRIVKEKNEIILLKKSARIAISAFRKLLPSVRAGVSERELAIKLEFLIKMGGAEKLAFDAIVASGKNGASPHAKPTSKKLSRGELVTLDFGAYCDGYASDVTRTVAIGKPNGKLKEIYEIVRQAQELGVARARAGITGRELDRVCRSYIEKKGYGKYFLHGTGHGLGMEVHELPIVNPRSTQKLPLCAVITCEPGIYIKGLGGVRIEDMLVLEKRGNANLSEALGKDLFSVSS